MFKNPKNILKSYVVEYMLLFIFEAVLMYNTISTSVITDYELMMAMVIMVPLFLIGLRSFVTFLMVIFFQMMMYDQLNNIKTSLTKHKTAIRCIFFFPLLIPCILLFKNSFNFNSLSFLASFYLLFIYVVVGFNSLLLLRITLYNNGNDFFGSVGWLTIFTLGIIGSDIPSVFKLSFIAVETILLFVISCFLLRNFVTFPLKKQKRLKAGSVWQISVTFQKKNIFKELFTFHNILTKEQMDTRCDFFQNGCVLLSSTYTNKSIEEFIRICQDNYYVIIDAELYNQFVVENRALIPNVIIVAIKTDEFINGSELVPHVFEEIVSDFYRLRLQMAQGIEKLKKKRKK